MSTAIDRALAELRAVPMRETTGPEPKPETEPSSPGGCCTGDRRGYQWHQRTGNLPACEAAREAAVAYGREYLRKWRAKNPDYNRQRRAQQKSGGAA
jgi:hypothetical protein